MDIRLISAPGDQTLKIIESRSRLKFEGKRPGAIGLVQGKVIEMLVASDIAEKCVGVEVADLRGNCPNNFVTLAIAGERAEVMEALTNIKEKEGKI